MWRETTAFLVPWRRVLFLSAASAAGPAAVAAKRTGPFRGSMLSRRWNQPDGCGTAGTRGERLLEVDACQRSDQRGPGYRPGDPVARFRRCRGGDPGWRSHARGRVVV